MVHMLETKDVACIIYDNIMKFIDVVAKRLRLPTILLRTTSATFMHSHLALFHPAAKKSIPWPGIFGVVHDSSMKLFDEMLQLDNSLILVHSAVKLGDLEKGFELMNGMKKCGIRANGFVYNVGLCKERRVADAQKLFDEMSNRNIAPNRVTDNFFCN
ncbi:hypothetical protein C2S51_015826 [Perilla frutescens var. frutescens]|nr:hypothetical protein C2S51_015826 [Perilla frutescens var. frutescens]